MSTGPASLGLADVRRLMDEHGLRPSKALGQHFVADPNTVGRIVRLAGVDDTSHVVEVGAGLGSLTLALGRTGAEVVAVEVDRHLVPVLRSVVGECGNVRVVEGDGLRLDFSQILGEVTPWTLVANLPYNVATPIVVRVLEEAPQIRSMLVMVQREVAERLAAAPGTRAYGAVSVKVRYWAQAAVVGSVPPTVFVPRPSVDSALVRIVRRDVPALAPGAVTYRRLCAVVQAGFGQRRKMLRRSLAGVVEPDAFGAAGVAPTARAEELDVAQWGALAARTPPGAVTR
ncbi:MAG TPA: 16S rRNA (adenine(1518)-N(6)/adenine(1519)-N(6))-dimethyltransferase RsmA [Acidimicrobiales bacterium]|nr:16S rRNA (adenine(1518)-N(6)/adenine(1519)-N(6))-dimethyltransferase RsmA [Acidimicrobiales bacterium]